MKKIEIWVLNVGSDGKTMRESSIEVDAISPISGRYAGDREYEEAASQIKAPGRYILIDHQDEYNWMTARIVDIVPVINPQYTYKFVNDDGRS